jgi:hypothetical protein
MAKYKAVENEPTHSQMGKKKPHAFPAQKHKKKSMTETPASKSGDKYKKSPPGKTNS